MKGGIGFEATLLAAGAAAPIRRDDDMTDFTGIAESAAKRCAVLNHAKPDTGTEINHGEIGNRVSCAEQAFADGGGIRVVFDQNGFAAGFAQNRRCIDPGPAGQGGRTDRTHAFNVKRTRHHDAYAEQARGKRSLHRIDFFSQLCGEPVGADILNGAHMLRARLAGKIKHRRHHMRRTHFHTDGHRAFGIDGKLDRRLAAPRFQSPQLHEQIL